MADQELILAGVDVPELMQRLMNNQSLVKRIIGKFLEDTTFAQLKAAVAAQDWKGAEFACHSLKGVSGNLSVKALFALMQEQLRLFRSGQPEAAAAMMEQITGEYERTVTHLKLWLAQQG